ncbi:MAG: hypothetical protein IH831_06795 [Planctomycetes bacterium]|nr:hypothetical protein [Planctomycetota bacterium]
MNRSSHGFDFTAAMRRLCRDMVARLAELSHINLERVAIGLCQTRQNGSHGLYASLTPLKFEAGADQQILEGRRYEVQRLCDQQGRELLYVLSFFLPRFQNTSLEEKLSTVLHELWHISPEFDGDLRRHAGRCYAHGPSQREYDAQMDRLAQRWLALDPPWHLYEFLTLDFSQLVAEHGQVVGARWPTPKLLPL